MIDLSHVAALARALENHVVIYRDVLDLHPDGTWRATERLYRGWFTRNAAPRKEKGEPDV